MQANHLMKGNYLRAGFLFMGLVIMLAALGLGVALWFKIITVTSTVNTGTVHAQITDAFTDDDDAVDNQALDSMDVNGCDDKGVNTDNAPAGFEQKTPLNDGKTSCDPAASGKDIKPHYDKDVARCDARIDPTDDNKAEIIKTNVYPSYFCTAWLVIENTGSIPIKIASVEVDGQPVTPSTTNGFDLIDTFDAAGAPDGFADVDIHISLEAVCTQIDPGDTFILDIDQHILQEAPQGATFGYEVVVQLNQWNEPCEVKLPLNWLTCSAGEGICAQDPQVQIALSADDLITMGVLGVAESGSQPQSYHGASAPLPAAASYDVAVTYDVCTWDSYNVSASTFGGDDGFWDSFGISVSQGSPYWLKGTGDPLTDAQLGLPGAQGFPAAGGIQFDDTVLEGATGDGSAGSCTDKGGAAVTTTLHMPGDINGNNFLNIGWDTGSTPQANGAFPSYGTVNVTSVTANATP